MTWARGVTEQQTEAAIGVAADHPGMVSRTAAIQHEVARVAAADRQESAMRTTAVHLRWSAVSHEMHAKGACTSARHLHSSRIAAI